MKSLSVFSLCFSLIFTSPNFASVPNCAEVIRSFNHALHSSYLGSKDILFYETIEKILTAAIDDNHQTLVAIGNGPSLIEALEKGAGQLNTLRISSTNLKQAIEQVGPYDKEDMTTFLFSLAEKQGEISGASQKSKSRFLFDALGLIFQNEGLLADFLMSFKRTFPLEFEVFTELIRQSTKTLANFGVDILSSLQQKDAATPKQIIRMQMAFLYYLSRTGADFYSLENFAKKYRPKDATMLKEALRPFGYEGIESLKFLLAQRERQEARFQFTLLNTKIYTAIDPFSEKSLRNLIEELFPASPLFHIAESIRLQQMAQRANRKKLIEFHAASAPILNNVVTFKPQTPPSGAVAPMIDESGEINIKIEFDDEIFLPLEKLLAKMNAVELGATRKLILKAALPLMLAMASIAYVKWPESSQN